ncbi:hypothetical protein G6F23_015931 [Rhizopus arrhizus]|nr:hypothetical protein G6F23_015931 [Rhizopus arrhizus]
MPATARDPSGTRVDVLCGQPEQNQGLRSSTSVGRATSRSLASMTARRAAMRARSSSDRSALSSRAAMARAISAGDSS